MFQEMLQNTGTYCNKLEHRHEIGQNLEKLRISPYLVGMQENTDQKNFEYGHFSPSVSDSLSDTHIKKLFPNNG